MPIYDDDYIYVDISGTSWSTSSGPWSPHTFAQEQYEEYQRERERQDSMLEQMWHEEQERIDKMDELRRDKEKYPLFFLKEGIV